MTNRRLKRITRKSESLGAVLADAFNHDPNGETTQWATAIIRLLTQGHEGANARHLTVVAQDNLAALDRLLGPFHFKIYPRGIVRGQWVLSWRPVTQDPRADLALMLFDLAGTGAIRRLRQCRQCGSWFFASRNDKYYCPGGQCLEAVRRSSNEYREEQRKRVSMHYYKFGKGQTSNTPTARKWRREWEKREWEKQNARKTR